MIRFSEGLKAYPITRLPAHPTARFPYPPARDLAVPTHLFALAIRTCLLGAGLALGACAGEVSAPTAGGADADSARAILSTVSPALAAEAFARLQETTYTAEIRMEDVGAPATVRRIRHVPGADSGDGAALVLVDPVSRMVPQTPPHLAPRTRDRYRVRLLPEVQRAGRRLIGAEASLLDPSDGEPLRRVRSWIEASTGEPYAVEVWRSSDSAIFDEEGRAGVTFTTGTTGVLPAASGSLTHVHVPLGEPRRVRVDVTIRDVGS